MADHTITSTAPATGVPPARRPASRTSRATRWLAIALILAGAVALADGIVTLVWQEPISALIATLRQDRLRGELREVEEAPPTAAEEHALAGIADERSRIAFLAGAEQGGARAGSPVGRIVIPRIGASFVVVSGTGTSELESGPGVYSRAQFPGTGFPGSGATTAIAGHRTTYLAPFRHIDTLAPGNTVRLQMPYGDFVYTVIGRRVVQPQNVAAAVADLGYDRLVLSACTPLFSAEKRLLVYARLTSAVPVGAARLLVGGQLARQLVYPLHPVRQRPLPPVLKSFGPYLIPAS